MGVILAKITIRGDLNNLKAYLKSLTESPAPGVKVGVQAGSTYSEGPLAGQSVAVNLARHEFGAPKAGIPARAPFRTTLAKKKGQWAKDAAAYLMRSAGHIDPKAALTAVGDVMAMDIQQSFNDGLEPALKPATIRAKMRITREGTKTGKKKSGKNKGQYFEGDYIGSASTPVVLTGTAQKSITSVYVDDVTKVGS